MKIIPITGVVASIMIAEVLVLVVVVVEVQVISLGR